MVFVLRKFKLHKLLVPKVIDSDPSGDATRDELERMRQRYDSGVEALAKQITGEPNAGNTETATAVSV
jgi:hypothetical protein